MGARNLRQRLPVYYDEQMTQPVSENIELDDMDPLLGGEYEFWIHNAANKTAVFKNQHQRNGRTQAILPARLRPHETAKMRVIIEPADNAIEAMDDQRLNIESNIDWEEPSFGGDSY